MDKTISEQILDITFISDRLANKSEKHTCFNNDKESNHNYHAHETLVTDLIGMMTKRWPLSFQIIRVSYLEFDDHTAMIIVSNGKMKRSIELYINTKTGKRHFTGSDIEVDSYTLGIIFGTLFLSTITATGN